jgi:hypothetical protein
MSALRFRAWFIPKCGRLCGNARLNRLKIIVLVGLTGLDLCAGAFAWRAVAGRDEGLVARPAIALVAARPAELVMPAHGEDPETLARPLFSKSRRPSPKSQTRADGGSPPPLSPPAGIKMDAVILFDRAARAFISSNALVEGKWLAVGDSFENWTVDSIAPQEVALHRDASSIRIGLAYNGVSSPIISNSQLSMPAMGEAEDPPWPIKTATPPTFDDVRSRMRSRR